MSTVNAFNGFVGIGFRHLGAAESALLCSDQKQTPQTPPFDYIPQDYESDFSMRIITSGCYYMDISSGNWTSDGLDILKSSGLTSSVCSSTHLTVCF
jgi:hypothetical protein